MICSHTLHPYTAKGEEDGVTVVVESDEVLAKKTSEADRAFAELMAEEDGAAAAAKKKQDAKVERERRRKAAEEEERTTREKEEEKRMTMEVWKVWE